ncbi:subtilase-type protease inhibitor [Glycomyces sp. L485]|uniref:SSI family serine proteinase inhibitor n=1 Tax=Glycomyces sp. L485 TaxID=2909235 RepID=UPI001F4AC856|nr:SSI family serine proteinase inhibitor [Glycomyces sp. L485]MCH7229855.1 subtilase-type protease inhibitor [Glycomyces sp. L485]
MFNWLARIAAALGAIALVSFSAPAQAAPASDGPHGRFMIHWSAVDGGESATVSLACPQEWSEHPNAEQACAQIEGAGGSIERIEPVSGFCTKEYAPVRVMMIGHWHETWQFFTGTFANRCEANLATGGHLLDI